jgi:hypothetical protein
MLKQFSRQSLSLCVALRGGDYCVLSRHKQALCLPDLWVIRPLRMCLCLDLLSFANCGYGHSNHTSGSLLPSCTQEACLMAALCPAVLPLYFVDTGCL